MIKNELMLYVHIPFCIRKCAYCDFLSRPAGRETRASYVDALIREIESRKETYADHCVSSIFLGGGTPSVLSGDDTARIFHALRENFDVDPDAEITMEVNPGTVTLRKARQWKTCGINRLSIGLQSADDRELRLLGRIHSYRDFLRTLDMVRDSGFENINADLISAVPGQTAESWAHTLRTVAQLGLPHISAYSLIIEEETVFARRYAPDGSDVRGDAFPGLPDEDTEREMYQSTERILQEYGLFRYEISNYAVKGRECRHNLGYWKRREYLGLGLGSSSLVNENRFRNTDDMKRYLEKPDEPEMERQILSVQDQMEEFMFLGLRLTEGVSLNDFFRKFGKSAEEVYGNQIRKLRQQGLIETEPGIIRLTSRGTDLSNYVFSEFLF